MDSSLIFFLVIQEDHKVIVTGKDREEAKRNAQPFLGNIPDYYIVEPLTNTNDKILAVVCGSVIIHWDKHN